MTATPCGARVAVAPAHPVRPVWTLTVRQCWRGALIVLVVTAGMTGLVAAQYQVLFADAMDRQALQLLAANPAIRVLFGPPIALDDPGGFTVWRTGTPVTILVSAWALLAATRMTRGEEDAGRWDLLLGGRVPRTALVGSVLGVLAAAVLLTGAAIATALLVTGTAPAGALIHAAGVAGVGLAFAALGVWTAQLLPARAPATGTSVAVLGAALLARMVADGVDALAWMHWVNPLGWLAEARPYAGDHLAPLLPLAVVPLVLAVAALRASRGRDHGGGLVPARTRRRPRMRLLHSLDGFAMRQALRPTAGWSMGVGAFCLLIGTLAASLVAFLDTNPRFAELAAAAGFAGLGTTTGYAATMLQLLAIPAGIYAAVRIAAAAADETSGNSILLIAQPVSRLRILATEAAVAAGGVTVLLTVAAVALWAGNTLAGTTLSLPAALAGAFNTAPVAALCLGAALLTWGLRPRHVAVIGSLPAVGGFLLHVLAPTVGAPDWVGRLSPFAHLAQVPHAPPDWPATATLAGIAAALLIIGMLAYPRRDLVVT